MSATEKRVDEKTNKVLTKGRIEVRFALEQRKNIGIDENKSYKPIMLQIQSFFGINTDFPTLRESKHNGNKTYWIIEVTSLNKLSHLIQYLNKYPLLTEKKRGSYLNFRNTFLSKVLNSKRATIEDKNYCVNLLKDSPDILYTSSLKDQQTPTLKGRDYFDN